MELFDDFKELFECLNENNVEYVVVGGYAVAFHGAPRLTGDIDVYFDAEKANAEQLVRALDDFGFGSLNLTTDDFSVLGSVIRLGVPPVRIDLMNQIDGVDWHEVWGGRMQANYDGVPIDYIGRAELVRNKQATGRLKDRADLEALGEEDLHDE
jgi:hypothetical protein